MRVPAFFDNLPEKNSKKTVDGYTAMPQGADVTERSATQKKSTR